jgi:Tfp pilus assembly protein PilX
MHPSNRRTELNAGSQRGTTLVVALVLILLASLLAFFALNVGLYGQRTSANDVRARLVQQAAESGISQGIEYFRANFTTALDPTDATQWTQCSAGDTTFPCNVAPVCANGAGSTSCTSTGLQRRGNMFKYTKGASYDVNGNGSTTDAIDSNSLPLDRTIGTTVGNGFNVNYGVGALLCMVKQPTTAGEATQCTTNPALASNVKILTLTSIARIPGESANTTITQTTGLYSKINNLTNAPPLVASGAIDLTGGLQMVTSPNAAGTGVPVSVWTRLAVAKTGTPNTCYLNDFISDPKQTPSFMGTNPQIVVCDNCDCQVSLSYANSGNTQQEGIDILNIENNPPNVFATATATPVVGTSACKDPTQMTCRPNFDIKPNEFPCDLFQFIFGTKAWDDNSAATGAAYAGCGDNGNSGDCFCESAEALTTYSWTDSNGVAQNTSMRVDDKWLYTNANYVIPRNLTGDPTSYSTAKIIACSDLNSSSSGLIWDQTGNCIPTSGDIGSPDNPVLLVEDELGSTTVGVHIQSKPRLFGLLFVRVQMASPPGTANQVLDPSTGGLSTGPAYAFQMEGGTVYGAVVVQGAVKKGNGGGTIVSEPLILKKLLSEPQLNQFANVPGSWSDRFSY